MEKTAALETLTLNQFAELMVMMKSLLNAGLITRAEADMTARRIASEYELTPIYLW